MKSFIFCCTLLALVQSCCKEACPDDSVTFHLQQFDGHELDTIQVLTYPRGSGFNLPLDSFYHRYRISQQGPVNLRFTAEVNHNRDIELRLPLAGKQYRITEIQSERFDCRCESGSYRQVKSFKINNDPVVDDDEIGIVK